MSVNLRRIVLVAAAGILVLGIVHLDNLKTDLLPEFSPVAVEVQTEALGLSASEVERLITTPLEQDLLSGVAFLDTIESASLPGLSSVVMTFQPGTTLLNARQVVAERLVQAAGLPQVAGRPQMLQPFSSTGRVALISLSSDELTPIETSVLARWVVVPRLLGVDGVASVSIWGFRDRQLQVLVDPTELASQDVTLSQVIATAGNALEVSPLTFLEASSPGTGGFIDTVNQRLHVFHEQAISTPEELAQVALEDGAGGAVFVDGQPLTLGDVSAIVADHQPLIGDAYCSGGPCVMLVIEKFPNSNTPAVVANIEDAIEALQPGLQGITIDSSIYQPAEFIETSFGNLGTALSIGLVLAFVVMAALLYDWRVVLVGALTIATSLAGAGLVLYLAGATVNTMTLAGLTLALVLIVDDALVGSRGLFEPTSQSRPDDQGARLARRIADSALRTRSATFYAAIIVGAAALTFYFVGGEAGAFLPHIATPFLLALAVSLLVSLTVAPALTAFIIRTGSAPKESSPLTRRMKAAFERVGPGMATKVGRSVLVFALAVGLALASLPLIEQSFRPDLKQRDVLIELDAPAGTSLSAMDAVASDVVAAVGLLDVVVNIGAHVGRAVSSDQVENVNVAEVWLKLDEAADYEAALAAVSGAVVVPNNVTSRVLTYSDQRVSQILGGSSDELIVRVYGDNPQELEAVAATVTSALSEVRGLEDVRIDLPIEQPTIEVEVDLARAQAVGLKPGDVRRNATTLLSGVIVGNLFESQKVFDVIVWGTPEIRESVEDVMALPIATPDGGSVALSDVADVQVVPNISVIRHESVSTYLDVVADPGSRPVADVRSDVAAALDTVGFPLEYHAEVRGVYAAGEAGGTGVLPVILAALFGIFILFQSAFSSWRLAFILFLTVPMALSGGVIAIVVSGRAFSLGSVAALVALLGLAARSSILLVQVYQRRERAGETFGVDLVTGATADEMVSIVTPLLAVAALFVPLGLAGSQAGLEIVGDMAWVIVGGAITTALFSLVILPAFYLRWGYVAEPDTVADDLSELLDVELTELGTGGE
ncbi:MAG: efflux RND transporter permease subunit [Acidimicrobiia bacterium]|nr:efflux RND transporter permease subunit [Acidimicrobiia bacterium]